MVSERPADEDDLRQFSADPREQHPLIREQVVGGVSYWISGKTQMTASENLTHMIHQLRHNLPPAFPILTGGYLIHSRIGWLPPPSFYDMLSQSIELYDRNEIEGFFVFAGNALQGMNATEWQAYNLPAHLKHSYFPWLGSATVSVTAAVGEGTNTDGNAGATPVADAAVTVVWNGSTAVTRKQTGAGAQGNTVSFGGWVGKSKRAAHTIFVSAVGYEDATATVQLKA
eukprot:SAG31_NODE_7596_length_1644_cov_1.820712_2_plen_227_part_01